MLAHKGIPRTHLHRMVGLATTRTTAQAIQLYFMGGTSHRFRTHSLARVATAPLNRPAPPPPIQPDTVGTVHAKRTRFGPERIHDKWANQDPWNTATNTTTTTRAPSCLGT